MAPCTPISMYWTASREGGVSSIIHEAASVSDLLLGSDESLRRQVHSLALPPDSQPSVQAPWQVGVV